MATTSPPIRGTGDGMETEEPLKSIEVTTAHAKVAHSPRRKTTPPLSESPGVLHLGKINTDKAVEIEAFRIIVPKAAITHTTLAKQTKTQELNGHGKADVGDCVSEPWKQISELKSSLEKLKNSEKRLLQDKEGLSNQLKVQTELTKATISKEHRNESLPIDFAEVNRELKKLLVASVGDDLQYHFERTAREKNQLILENEALARNTAQLSEQLERMSIQCDVWRSKFLASRVMADELTNVRTNLQRHNREAQSALQDLLSEREQFRQEMSETQKVLEELLVSLQWGRQQTYYPTAQPYTTTELVAATHKLAVAVKSHLIGNTGSESPKHTSQAIEFCCTPAEKMAEMILKAQDPICCTETLVDIAFSESSSSSFLAAKKSIGRFHPYTRYENITFNCCERCHGELIAL